MRFCVSWLREICPVEAEVRELADALTARGLTVDAVEAWGDDHVLDVDVPANRPDCLGHLGLARELSAAFGVALRRDHPAPPGPMARPPIEISVEDPRDCGRYTARIVRGVRVEPSPSWVVDRLEACGLRSISNVVDISNLVLLESGNPIHFFDIQRIRRDAIRVRRAAAGERLTTLDGVERQLDPEMLVIADGEGAVALAGVMGGADSEIQHDTRDVLIEAAWFSPSVVRRTARKLAIQTDASHRFERGVDPAGVLAAQELAVRWLTDIAGGRVEPGWVDAHPRPRKERTLTLRRDQLGRLLGYQPSPEESDAALAALRLDPQPVDAGTVRVTAPSWRVDLEREADLVEEVARHLGYDRVPVSRPEMTVESVPHPVARLAERVRDRLAHLGFHEAFGYAMIGEDQDAPWVAANAPPPLPLANPLSQSMGWLRRSLVPGLLEAVERNLRRGIRDVRLFEVEHVFLSTGRPGELPDEPMRVALAWSGEAQPRHWASPARQVDVYDIAGIVERLLDDLRPARETTRTENRLPGVHPGRALAWSAEGAGELAWAGELHPALARELKQPVLLAAIDLSSLARLPDREPSYTALPRLGTVARDLAVVLPAGRSYAEALAVLRSVPAPARAEIEPTDRYTGPPLESGESSLTVRVTLQPDERPLTEAEIEAYRQSLVAALVERLGLRIRD